MELIATWRHDVVRIRGEVLAEIKEMVAEWAAETEGASAQHIRHGGQGPADTDPGPPRAPRRSGVPRHRRDHGGPHRWVRHAWRGAARPRLEGQEGRPVSEPGVAGSVGHDQLGVRPAAGVGGRRSWWPKSSSAG